MSPVKRSWTKGLHGEVDIGKTARIAWAAGPPPLGPKKAKQPAVLLCQAENVPSPKLGGAWAARDQSKGMSMQKTSSPGAETSSEQFQPIQNTFESKPTAEVSKYYAAEPTVVVRGPGDLLEDGGIDCTRQEDHHVQDCVSSHIGDRNVEVAPVAVEEETKVFKCVSGAHTYRDDFCNEGDAGVASAGVSTALVAGVKAWLHEMRLDYLQSAVLRWCADMGAAYLEEVVEHSAELADALHLAETQEGKRILSDTHAALVRVQAMPVFAFTEDPASSDADALPTTEVQRVGCVLAEQSCQLEVWAIPVARERQGKKKKDRIQRRESGDLSTPSSQSRNKSSAAIAKEKLELQLQKERDAATEALVAAVTSELLDQLTHALDTFEKVGAKAHDLLLEARQLQERLTRRLQDRCKEAVCALQAAIEAPRDDHFGVVVRDALQSVEHARKAQGGQIVADQAETALRVWQEVQMALRLAVRSQSSEAICLAVDEAKANNLPPRHSLVMEIRRMRQIS